MLCVDKQRHKYQICTDKLMLNFSITWFKSVILFNKFKEYEFLNRNYQNL